MTFLYKLLKWVTKHHLHRKVQLPRQWISARIWTGKFPPQLLTDRHWSSGEFCSGPRGSPCGKRYSPCLQTSSIEASFLQQPQPRRDLYGSQLESLQRHKTPPKNVTCYLTSFLMLSSSSQHNTGHQYDIKYPQGEALHEKCAHVGLAQSHRGVRSSSLRCCCNALTRSSAQEADRHRCTFVSTYLDRISRNWVLHSFGCHYHAQGKISNSLSMRGYRHRDPTYHHVGISNRLHL